MLTDAATAIAYTGAFVGLVGGGVALFNARKAVCWKRAELANTYMKDFNNNPELVFAGRCLDWQVNRARKFTSIPARWNEDHRTRSHALRCRRQSIPSGWRHGR